MKLLGYKAEEYRAYRKQIDGLDDRVAGIANLKGAATDAANNLDFEEVETLLARVDEVETEILAETKVARAQNALLRGEVDQAYRLLDSAVCAFSDPVEEARRRTALFIHLHNHGLRYGGKSLKLAADFVRTATENLNPYSQPLEFGKAQNNLAIVLETQGSRTSGDAGLALSKEAVHCYRAALDVFSMRKDPIYWAKASQNLGVALQALGNRTKGSTGRKLIQEAIENLTGALSIRTEKDHPYPWAQTKVNLGIAFKNYGALTKGERSNTFFEKSIACYRAARRVYTERDFPTEWAQNQQSLGIALGNYGGRISGHAGAELLHEAQLALNEALRVNTKIENPIEWAKNQENQALLYQSWAGHDSATDPKPHLQTALVHVDAALTVYDDTTGFYLTKATKLRAEILAALAALDT